MLGGLLFQGCFWKPRCDGQHLGLFCSQLCHVALERGEGIEIVPTAGGLVLGQAVRHGRISGSGAENSWLCFREYGENCLETHLLSSEGLQGCQGKLALLPVFSSV